ncbi:MAG: AmmeMemoRadiSam system protein B [Gammaproteobacteria bacterium]|nr:AmmeMemoRadiSam system protein B [Gammaproteobacteria bacterium]MDH3465826.1 AmmeMemoRadiSam system protein B [Gammaproteobacteria bacterium]
MTSVRSAAVAGSFYPSEPRELRKQLGRLLSAAGGSLAPPKAVIVPHAGYVYSGAVAAAAYAALHDHRDTIRRVVLLGPAHRVYLAGLGAPTAAEFETPLGRVAIDQDAVAELLANLPFVQARDDAHRDEHSLEVQIPFLQTTLGDFRLLPLVVGDAPREQVEIVLERIWGGAETLIVVSSDLSHYHQYAVAQQIDGSTTSAIEQLRPEAIDSAHACGQVPLRALLGVAKHRHMEVHTAKQCNSGDTAGPTDRVVGYGAYLFYERSAT